MTEAKEKKKKDSATHLSHFLGIGKLTSLWLENIKNKKQTFRKNTRKLK